MNNKVPSELDKFNKRVGARIRVFREMRGLSQIELATALGYKSTGAFSLIENGARGLNKTKLNLAAKILGTYPEVLQANEELSTEELIDLNTLMQIRKDPKHPRHKMLLNLLKK